MYSITDIKCLIIWLCSLFLIATNVQAQASFTYEYDGEGLPCAPITVNFQNTSSQAVSYSWAIDGITYSQEENPIRTFATGGLYNVCLTATLTNGQTDEYCEVVDVYDPPSVELSLSPETACAPADIQFTATSTVDLDSILWDFGDGNLLSESASGTSQTTTHNYTIPGNYTLTLTVFDINGCKNTILQPNIYIGQVPQPNFTADPRGGCSIPHEVTFNNTTPNVGSLIYEWDFGDGSTSSDFNPTHTYQNYGTYDVTLTAIEFNAGCSNTIVLQDFINVGNVADFIYTVINGDCTQTSIQFTNTSSGDIVSSEWDFGDGESSNEMNPMHIYTEQGCFYPELTVATSDGCISTIISDVCVQAINGATADYTSIGDLVGCDPEEGLDVTFNGTGTNVESWFWNFGGLGNSTEQNPSFNFNQAGQFPISLSVSYSNGCTETIINDTVIIQPMYVDFTRDVQEGCAPLEVNFQSIVQSIADVDTYFWDFEVGTSTEENPTFVFTDTGTYDIKLVVTNSLGCTDSIYVLDYIKVGMAPNIAFEANPQVSCLTDAISFENNTTGTVDDWFWQFGDGGTSVLEEPVYEYSDTGLFTVTLIGSHYECYDTLEIEDYIQIYPPRALFNVSQECGATTITFSDQSLGADTYFWDFGDGETSTEANPVHTYATTGSYTISLTVTNTESGCEDDTSVLLNVSEGGAFFTLTPPLVCTWDSVFVENVLIGDGVFSWGIPNGVGILADGPYDDSPIFYFPTPGQYTGFSLTVTDASGCVSEYVSPDTITVSGMIPNFSYTASTSCSPLIVEFQDETQAYFGDVTSYFWDFGDGETSTEQHPTHEYTIPGTYTVSLTVENEEGCENSHSIVQAISVIYPTLSFDVSQIVCGENTLQFTSTSDQGGLQYNWDFGDGEISTEVNPQHTFADEGTYTVCLSINSDNTCAVEHCETIDLYEPVANFEGDVLYKSCPDPPLVTNFTDQSEGAINWLWDFGDGTGLSTLQNPTHSFSQAGRYTICLIVENVFGCTDTLCREEYIVVEGPTGSFSYDRYEGCAELEVNFVAEGENIVEYNWDFGDGTGLYNLSTMGDTVSHTYTTGGQYLPIIIIEDASGCRVPVVGPDTIKVQSLGIDFMASDTAFCEGATVPIDLTAMFSDPSIITDVNWEFEGTTISNSTDLHPTGLIFEESGIFDIQLNVSSAFCEASIRKDSFIIIHPNPITSFIATPDDGCAPVTVSFQDSTILDFGEIVEWNWQIDNQTATTEVVEHIFTTPGSYPVSLETISGFGCSGTYNETINIYDGLAIALGNDEDICLGETVQLSVDVLDGNATSYQWSPTNGLSCTDCPSPMATPQTSTLYSLTAISSNGCTTTDSIFIEVGSYSIPTLIVSADTTICEGESIQLMASGGNSPFDYYWDESSAGLNCYTDCFNPIATPLTTTTYIVHLTGEGGCAAIDSITVTVTGSDLNLTGEDQSICAGGTATLNIAAGTNPTWSPSESLSCTECPNPVAQPMESTTYTVEVLYDGCVVTDEVSVHVLAEELIDLGEDWQICLGEEIQLTTSYTGSTNWLLNGEIIASNQLEINASPQETSTYILQATAENCVVNDTVLIDVSEKANILVEGATLCEGEQGTLLASGSATSFIWSPAIGLSNPSIPDPTVQINETTTYTVIGQHDICEADTVEVTVNVLPPPDVQLAAKLDFVEGTEVPINATVNGTPDFIYEWSEDETLSCWDCEDPVATPDSNQVYQLTVIDGFGCIDSASIELRLRLVCEGGSVLVPNAFTPNGDGQNDKFYVRGSSEIQVFRVFNRWGELVFETTDADQGWDGTYKDKELNRDVYVYYIEAICEHDGSIIVKTGDVTLIR